MQQVELKLRVDFEFYCPVTGQKMLGVEEPFEASPATVFGFVESEGAFEYANNWTEEQFGKYIKRKDGDVLYVDFDKFYIILNNLLKVRDHDNLVCFSITTRGMACGPTFSIVHFCIDMNYISETIKRS